MVSIIKLSINWKFLKILCDSKKVINWIKSLKIDIQDIIFVQSDIEIVNLLADVVAIKSIIEQFLHDSSPTHSLIEKISKCNITKNSIQQLLNVNQKIDYIKMIIQDTQVIYFLKKI